MKIIMWPNRLTLIVSGLLMITVLLLGACAPTAAPIAATPKENVVLSLLQIAPTTGIYAGTIYPLERGSYAACEHANDTKYIPGVEIKHVSYNSEADPAKAVTAFKRGMSQNPKPVAVDAVITGDFMALKELVKREMVPAIGATVNPQAQGVPGEEWLFGHQNPYDGQICAFVDYFKTKVWKEQRAPRFAYVTWDTAFGRTAITEEAIAYIKSKGVEYMGAIYIPASPSDTMPQVLQMKDWGVDIIAGAIYAEPLQVFLKDVARGGMQGKFVGMSGAWLGPRALTKYLGAQADGWVFMHHFLDRTEFPTWMADSFTRYGLGDTDETGWACGILNGALAVEAFKGAVDAVGATKVTGDEVRKAMRKITNYKALCGVPLDFSKSLIGANSLRVFIIKDGKPVDQNIVQHCPNVWPGFPDSPKK